LFPINNLLRNVVGANSIDMEHKTTRCKKQKNFTFATLALKQNSRNIVNILTVLNSTTVVYTLFHFISFHLFADNIEIYKTDIVISRLQVTTGQ